MINTEFHGGEYQTAAIEVDLESGRSFHIQCHKNDQYVRYAEMRGASLDSVRIIFFDGRPDKVLEASKGDSEGEVRTCWHDEEGRLQFGMPDFIQGATMEGVAKEMLKEG